MKNVWIINHYAGDMFANKGGRHYYFAKYLKKLGYDVTVFCSNSKHNSQRETHFDFKSIYKTKVEQLINVPFVFVKALPYQGNGIFRILNIISFYFNVIVSAIYYSKRHGKPNVIIASSVHPLTLLAGIQIAKVYKVKCICEIRDLWPESIVAYGIAKENNPLIQLLYRFERYLYLKSDNLVFTMENAHEYLHERHLDIMVSNEKVCYINNGVDLQEFSSNKERYRISDVDLDNNDIFKVIYTGSIRKVNNIGLLLDVAKLIKNTSIKFLIWGSGDELEELKMRLNREDITNVVFKGKVEKKYIPYILSKSDLNLMHNTPSPVLKYGLSANKLFEYVASGKPVLTDFSCGMNPSVKYNAGLVASDSAQSIADGIDYFSKMDYETYHLFCENAITMANHYSYETLTNKLIEVINS